jgi:hypothetical protein
MKLILRFVSAAALLLIVAGIYLAWPAVEGARLAPAEPPAPPPAAADLPDTPERWRALALQDLAVAQAILENNTPIPFDDANPAHQTWLRDGADEARALADQVEDYAGYFYLLARYVNGFRDPHINLVSTEPSDAPDRLPARWPGFLVSALESGAVVTRRDEADAAAPPLGARIVQCDGKLLAELAAETVFPFRLNPMLEADRRIAVTRLFLDRGNPFVSPPAVCTFEVDGAETERRLRWRDAPEPREAFWEAYTDAGAGAAATFGVEEPAPGVVWIGVPTFASGPETAPQLEALIDAVRDRGSSLRDGRAIIIDTRGNGGGNSIWADRLAEAIFTSSVLNTFATDSGKTAVDWRASPGNAADWRAVADEYAREFGPLSQQRLYALYLAGMLHRRSDAEPPLWREGPRDHAPGGGLTQRRPQGGERPFPARVYVVSNGSCGSSCLNFADRVLMVPGVQLIGAATSGDSPYMEVRQQRLPSGLVDLVLPQKVWRGMGRGWLEAYAPDVPYGGPWDDASVRAWVMALIETAAPAP